MKVIVSAPAQKYLFKLNSKTRDHILVHLDNLSKCQSNLDIKKLEKSDNYRLRIGDYRVIFNVIKEKKIIEVSKISHRKDIYKKK